MFVFSFQGCGGSSPFVGLFCSSPTGRRRALRLGSSPIVRSVFGFMMIASRVVTGLARRRCRLSPIFIAIAFKAVWPFDLAVGGAGGPCEPAAICPGLIGSHGSQSIPACVWCPRRFVWACFLAFFRDGLRVPYRLAIRDRSMAFLTCCSAFCR